jgi:hypothetical protein
MTTLRLVAGRRAAAEQKQEKRCVHCLPAAAPGETRKAIAIEVIANNQKEPGKTSRNPLRDFSGALSGFREIRMNEEAQAETATRETPARIEEHVRYRLTGLLREFQLVFRDKGLVLRGHSDGRPVAISSTTATTGYALEHHHEHA